MATGEMHETEMNNWVLRDEERTLLYQTRHPSRTITKLIV